MRFRTVTAIGFSYAGWLVVGCVVAVAAQQSPSPVAVSTVIGRELATGQTFVGTVMPLKRSSIGSAVDGRVIEFLVNDGDAVSKNQPLARLRTETLEIELAAANAELQLRQEELAELENGSTPEELAQSKSRMLAAKASREYSQLKYKRVESLYQKGSVVTEDELQEARSAANRDEQSFLEAKAQHDLMVRGPRKERIAQAKARTRIHSEQVRLIEDKISKHTIVAPFDGYVSAEHTEVGQWVSQGDPIAVVIQLSDVEIRVFVLGKHVAHLKVGASARVEVPAVTEGVFTGTVALIVPQADVRSRTFPVNVRVRNRTNKDGPVLKAGMLSRVALPTGAKQKMTLVHKDAVVLGRKKPVVFVIDQDSGQSTKLVAHAVIVELGVAEGDLIQVDGPLEPGMRVVVRGNERLQEGQEVTITEALSSEIAN